MEPVTISCKANYPIPIFPEINKGSLRIWRAMSMKGFQLNIANARTIHKLQGRSIVNMIINSWSNAGNWIYVALSRVTELKGLFLRQPLDHETLHGMCPKVRAFMEKMRTKPPPPQVEIRV
jgi:hypothetical protein